MHCYLPFLAIATSILLKLVLCRQTWTSNDIVNKDIDDSETHLTPDDFINAASLATENVQQILGSKAVRRNGQPIDWDTEPTLRAGKFEGDIHVGQQAAAVMMDSSGGKQHNAISNDFQKWPNKEIPYAISSQYGRYSKAIIAKAMDEFHKKSCVKFVPKKSTDRDYVYIYPEDGCYSLVGKVGGKQPISLDSGCIDVGTIVHELVHSTGFYHEQSRPDRDEWIKINYENIRPGAEDQFEKYSRREIQTLGAQYDYGSIMHYGPSAFARRYGLQTIVPLKDGAENMGQRDGFSETDLYKLNKLYQCDNVGNAPDTSKNVRTTTEESETFERGTTTPYDGEGGNGGGDENGSGDGIIDATVCENTGWFCFMKKFQGKCESQRERMRSQCAKACNLCDTSSSRGNGDGNGNDGDDNSNDLSLKGLWNGFRHTVGFDPATNCKDLDERCKQIPQVNHCVSNVEFARINCAKTCGFCVVGKSQEPANHNAAAAAATSREFRLASFIAMLAAAAALLF